MSNPNQTYYNLCNLQETFRKDMHIKDMRYIRWITNIINLKCGMFEYENLPGGVTNRIMNLAQIFYSNLAWYYNKGINEWQLCIYTWNSNFDEYYQPKFVTLLTLTGKVIKNNVPYEELIRVYDNYLDIPPFLTLNSDVDLILEMENTLRSNVMLLRLPMIFKGNKSSVADLQNLIKKAIDFNPFAIVDKNLGNVVESLKLDLPVSVSELLNLIADMKNMTLTQMGIYQSSNKRERLVTSEAQANNDESDTIYQELLNNRLAWVSELNKRGCNVILKESYVLNIEKEMELEVEKEVEIANATQTESRGVEDE